MVEILGQLIELEIAGNAVHAPGLGVGLEGTEHHLARVLLVIGAFVGHPQDRQLGQPGDRLRDDVEMLAGLQRHVGAGHAAHFAAPHARAVDHHVTGDMAAVAVFSHPVHAGNPAAVAGHAVHLHPLLHQRPARPRTLCQRQCDPRRVALPVLVEIDRPPHPVVLR